VPDLVGLLELRRGTSIFSASTSSLKARSRASPTPFAASAAAGAAACADSAPFRLIPPFFFAISCLNFTSTASTFAFAPPRSPLLAACAYVAPRGHELRTAGATGRLAAPVRPKLVR
jgi:hypothetical protein